MSENCKFYQYTLDAVENIDNDSNKGYKSLRQVLRSCNCRDCKDFLKLINSGKK